jgi:Tat protein secretion system quality control protein TatD with DNase activity
MRGKPNEPAYLAHIASAVAALWKTTPDECARITGENASRIFGLNFYC